MHCGNNAYICIRNADWNSLAQQDNAALKYIGEGVAFVSYNLIITCSAPVCLNALHNLSFFTARFCPIWTSKREFRKLRDGQMMHRNYKKTFCVLLKVDYIYSFRQQILRLTFSSRELMLRRCWHTTLNAFTVVNIWTPYQQWNAMLKRSYNIHAWCGLDQFVCAPGAFVALNISE